MILNGENLHEGIKGNLFWDNFIAYEEIDSSKFHHCRTLGICVWIAAGHMGGTFRYCSWIQDFEADFPFEEILQVYKSTNKQKKRDISCICVSIYK